MLPPPPCAGPPAAATSATAARRRQLLLSHALIEDTVLVVALGASVWVVLVGRVLATLLVIAAMARLPGRRVASRPHLTN